MAKFAVGNRISVGNNGGRPELYREEYAEQAFKFCLLGATDDRLAEFFGVKDRVTIWTWRQKHPEFANACARGREIADAEMVHSTYRRGIGYDVVVSEERLTKDGDPVECKKTVHIPGDPTSQQFWLRNRRPKEWNVAERKVVIIADASQMSDTELDKALADELRSLDLVPDEHGGFALPG